MMASDRKRPFLWFQLVVYLLVSGYLAADLLWLKGPVWRMVKPPPQGALMAPGLVARVHGRPITERQLEHELQVYAFRRGIDLSGLNGGRRDELRRAVLMRLIDDYLLRIKIEFQGGYPTPPAEEIERQWKQWMSRFSTPMELEAALKSHGLTREEMRARLVARWQQEHFLGEKMKQELRVEDDEVEAYYMSHREALTRPEQVRLRHLFAATLDHPGGEDEALVTSWAAELQSGQRTWQEVAKRSEDLASAPSGGELGWVSKDRIPADLGEVVFEMKAGQSRLVRSRLGVHWVNVLEKRPAHLPRLDELEAEIRSALSARKRVEYLKAFRRAMREEALNSEMVLIFERKRTGS